MKLYKLTDENFQTKNQTQWGENVTHETGGEGDLCGPGWLHAYLNPYLAVLLSPLHVFFEHPVLWEAEGDGTFKYERQLKVGCTKLTTLKQIPMPVVMTDDIGSNLLFFVPKRFVMMRSGTYGPTSG
jgi:hypothetical protein